MTKGGGGRCFVVQYGLGEIQLGHRAIRRKPTFTPYSSSASPTDYMVAFTVEPASLSLELGTEAYGVYSP